MARSKAVRPAAGEAPCRGHHENRSRGPELRPTSASASVDATVAYAWAVLQLLAWTPGPPLAVGSMVVQTSVAATAELVSPEPAST